LSCNPQSAIRNPQSADPQSQGTICQLLHTLEVGGAEVLAARLARQLGGRFRFVFACLDELGTLGGQLREEGFLVEVFNRRPGLDWRLAVRLGRFFRKEQVDVAHAHQYGPFFYAASARFLAWCPVLFTEHGRAFPDYPRRKRILANRVLLRRRDRVVGVGDAVKQALVNNEGISSERIAIIYNGVDLTPFTNPPTETSRAEARRAMGVGEEDFVILQVARLDYLKDHLTAVRTLGQVLRQRPNAHLVLIGEGPERDKIQQEIARQGVGQHIHLLGLRTDVPRLLAGADGFLLTSISEGIPLTVIEAMAAGLPVVGTRVGGMSEVVEEGVTGLLCPAGDDKALARELVRLADNPDLRAQLGEAGRQRAHARFSETRMMEEYARLYQEMIGSPTPEVRGRKTSRKTT
jgi:glycosyltransferase involved in cell wall biosynthesis